MRKKFYELFLLHDIKAAAVAGMTGSKKDDLCQRYEVAAENVKNMIESKRRINTTKVEVISN